MKIKAIANCGNHVINVLPEDEAFVLEYLKCRNLECAAIKLHNDRLICIEDFRHTINCRRVVERKCTNLFQSRRKSTLIQDFIFSDYYWELDED
jgi:hypothetical protein